MAVVKVRIYKFIIGVCKRFLHPASLGFVRPASWFNNTATNAYFEKGRDLKKPELKKISGEKKKATIRTQMRKAKWNNCTKVLNDWIARDVIHYFFARGRWMKGMNAEMESRPADIHETRGKMVWLNERFCFMTSIVTHVGTPSRGVLVPEDFFLGGKMEEDCPTAQKRKSYSHYWSTKGL